MQHERAPRPLPLFLELLRKVSENDRELARDALGGNMLADLAKRNMAMFEDATRTFTGKRGAAAADKAGSSDMDQLRAELAALQAKVDKMSR